MQLLTSDSSIDNRYPLLNVPLQDIMHFLCRSTAAPWHYLTLHGDMRQQENNSMELVRIACS